MSWCVSPLAAHLAAVAGAAVTDLLDEVEDEPGRRDDHEHDEGDGDEDQRAPVHVLVGTTLTHQHRDQHRQVPIQVSQHLLAVGFGDHHSHNVTGTCTQNQSGPEHDTETGTSFT